MRNPSVFWLARWLCKGLCLANLCCFHNESCTKLGIGDLSIDTEHDRQNRVIQHLSVLSLFLYLVCLKKVFREQRPWNQGAHVEGAQMPSWWYESSI